MNEIHGVFKMRFIGKPNGVLMRGCPSNYVQNEIYVLPYHPYGKMPYFELLDPPPVLKVPAAQVEDSVFENSIFVPPDFGDAPPPSGPPLSESSVKPMDAPAVPVDIGGVEELLDSVKAKKAKDEPLREEVVKAGDDMPPELVYELVQMGDGVIGEEGEVKIERRKKAKTD